MKTEWLKWFQTMKVAWSELLIYRTNFFLRVIGPTLVFFFIKYSLWWSVFQGDTQKVIAGYSLFEMMTYHLWIMIITMISRAYTSDHLSEDIRHGRISAYLIYPFSFWKFHTAKFLARQMVQIMIAMVTLLLVYWKFGHLLEIPEIHNVIRGIGVAVLVGIFWFTLQFVIGLMAFWLEETWTLMVTLEIISQFLSGAVIPLELYPAWLVKLLYYSPFPYVAFVPVKIFMGKYDDPLKASYIIIFWICFGFLLAATIWKRGLKQYTASGM